MGGCDRGGVAAQVPLAHCMTAVSQPGQVLGHDGHIGGQGVGSSPHQHIVLETCTWWTLVTGHRDNTGVSPVWIGWRPVMRALLLGVQMGLT